MVVVVPFIHSEDRNIRDRREGENMTQAIRSTANVTSGYNVKSEPSREAEPAGLSGGYRAGVIAGVLMLALILGVLYSSNHHGRPAAVSHAVQPVLSAPATVPVQAASVGLPAVPVAKKRVRRLAATVRYVNPGYGVSFRYARKYELLTGEELQPGEDGAGPVQMNFSEPGGEAIASVRLPARSFAGTDLQSAMFNVSVHNSLTLDKCAQFASSNQELSQGGVLSSSEAKIGAMGLTGMTDGGRGDRTYYHVFRDGTCYEFELALFTVSGGANGGLRPLDHKEVFGKLDKILSSVMIQNVKGESGE
jgi:hypothetical protein